MLRDFEVKEERMFQYATKTKKEMLQLTSFHIEQIDREGNKEADELAYLASSMSVVPEGQVTLLKSGLNSIEEEEVLAVVEVNDWREDIIHYLQVGDNLKGTIQMGRKYARYFLQDGHVYRRGFNNPHLKCLAPKEGEHLLQGIHAGCCGVHTKASDLIRKAIRAGFNWAQMEVEVRRIIRVCGQVKNIGK